MPTLWTVGHSSRSFTEFVELLQAHRIVHVIDVRAYPTSRRHPQFDRLELEARLPVCHMTYAWMPQLGGMRSPTPGSTQNAAWKEEGFRAYADHMQTPAFEAARSAVARLAEQERCAVMCAESQPLQCHRQLLADAFVARGWEVRHLMSARRDVEHRLSATARVDARGRVTYPGMPQLPFGPRRHEDV
jgi:uncharacterized protein (DUF488 family)